MDELFTLLGQKYEIYPDNIFYSEELKVYFYIYKDGIYYVSADKTQSPLYQISAETAEQLERFRKHFGVNYDELADACEELDLYPIEGGFNNSLEALLEGMDISCDDAATACKLLERNAKPGGYYADVGVFQDMFSCIDTYGSAITEETELSGSYYANWLNIIRNIENYIYKDSVIL